MLPDEKLAKLVNSYKKIGLGTPASWVVWSDDLKHQDAGYSHACNSAMLGLKGGVYDQAAFAVPKPLPHVLDYIRTMIAGPYRKYKHLLSLQEYSPGVYYAHVKDLGSIPAQVAYNFGMSTRAPIEFMEVVDIWQSLVDKGIDPNLALIISPRTFYGEATNPDTKVSLNLTVHNPNHWWFESWASWDGIMAGEYELDHPSQYSGNKSMGRSFKEAPSDSLPNSVIWGRLDKKALKQYDDKSIQHLVEMFK